MTNKIGFPKLCGNETLLNEYYKDVSPLIVLHSTSNIVVVVGHLEKQNRMFSFHFILFHFRLTSAVVIT